MEKLTDFAKWLWFTPDGFFSLVMIGIGVLFLIILVVAIIPSKNSNNDSDTDEKVGIDPKDGSMTIGIGKGFHIDTDGSGIKYEPWRK